MGSLIGRSSELKSIERVLDRARAGRAAVVIEGEPGIGKTALLRMAIAAAERRGIRTISARPAETESALPLSGFGDLFLTAAEEARNLLPGPQRRALEVALLLVEPLATPADRRILSVATTALLRALTRERPLLLAVDDVHWLDEPSAALLEYALRRVPDCRVAIVVSRRKSNPHLPLGLDSWGPPETEVIIPGPLSVAALHELLVDELGRSFSRLETVRIHDASAGNPLFALEIARALLRTGKPIQPAHPLPVPETLAELTTARIAALPEGTRNALVVAAAAVEPPTIGTLERAGVVDAAAALGPAAREGIVTVDSNAVRFAHPLLASATLELAGRDRLREIHAALARASESDAARAQHAAMATVAADEGTAALLEETADRPRARGAPIAAAELLEIAARLTPQDLASNAVERVCKAADCYFEAGESQRSSALLEDLVSALSPGPRRARALRLLGQVRARSMSFAEAASIARQALDEAGADPALRAPIELDLGLASFSLGDLPAAAGYAATALSDARIAGSPTLVARAIAGTSIAEFMLGAGVVSGRLEEAIAIDERDRSGPLEFRPRFVDGLLRLWTGDLANSFAVLSAIRNELTEDGLETSLPFISLFLVIGAIWRGDLAEASRLAEETSEVAALNGEPVASALASAQRALASSFRGEADAARADGLRALALFRESHFDIYATWPLWAMGHLELSLGNAKGTDVLLRPLADLVTGLDMGDPVLGIALPDEIEALTLIGEREDAERYLQWLEHRGHALDRPWALAVSARCRALIAISRDDHDGAMRSLTEALSEHARMEMPIELGRTLLLKGRLHRRRKEKRLAREALEQALAMFERAGCEAWASQARQDLQRLGGPAAPANDLSETELRVGQLVARGLTNREVGQAAFLAPKTVENILGRVYQKLGVTSRTQLAVLLAARSVGSKGDGMDGNASVTSEDAGGSPAGGSGPTRVRPGD